MGCSFNIGSTMQKFTNPLFGRGGPHPLENSPRRFGRDVFVISADGAVGNPFGGPARGRREEPISAAFAIAFSAEATAAAVATVISTVGVGMSVVGAITGNQGLVKIGGVLGLAGGAMGLASSAGLFGASEGLVPLSEGSVFTGNPTGGGIVSNAMNTGGALGDVTGSGLPGSTFSPDPNLPSSNVFNVGGNSASTITQNEGTGGGLISSSMGTPAASAAPATAAAPASSAPTASNYSATQTTLADNPAASAADAAGVTKPGVGQDIMSWYKSLPAKAQATLVSGLLQTGGQAVGAMFNGWSAEQKLALEQQAQNLKQQQYTTGMTNASAIPTVKFQPVPAPAGAPQ